MKHVTIAVSGAHGGKAMDFRQFAHQGMILVGRAGPFKDGVMHIAPDLAQPPIWRGPRSGAQDRGRRCQAFVTAECN